MCTWWDMDVNCFQETEKAETESIATYSAIMMDVTAQKLNSHVSGKSHVL